MKKGGYHEFDVFVRDVAQIFYNAKVYNNRSSEIFEDACTLEVISLCIGFNKLGTIRGRIKTTQAKRMH